MEKVDKIQNTNKIESVKISIIDVSHWDKIKNNIEELLLEIEGGGIIIVRGFMAIQDIEAFKGICLKLRDREPASWHPCLDDCPDYHRIHNNYANAHVPSVQHGYYFHPWNDEFKNLCAYKNLRDLFDIKRRLSKLPEINPIDNTPSDGIIARIVSHQYPRGGGGQSQHIDPVSEFAKIQTLIQASTPGEDYHKGGLYVFDQEFGLINIDALSKKGDLILLSPGVRHGVAAIDPEFDLDWSRDDGRWIIMPIFLYSDCAPNPSLKPRKVG